MKITPNSYLVLKFENNHAIYCHISQLSAKLTAPAEIIKIDDDINKVLNAYIWHMQNNNLTQHINLTQHLRNSKQSIVCNETNITYESLSSAARAIGASPSNLAKHLQGAKGFKTVKGYTFK